MTPSLPSDPSPGPFPFRPDSPIPARDSSSKWALGIFLATLALTPVVALSIRYYQQRAEEAEFRAALDAERAILAGVEQGDHFGECGRRTRPDRMIVAQAMSESLPLISADVQLDAYPIHRLW